MSCWCCFFTLLVFLTPPTSRSFRFLFPVIWANPPPTQRLLLRHVNLGVTCKVQNQEKVRLTFGRQIQQEVGENVGDVWVSRFCLSCFFHVHYMWLVFLPNIILENESCWWGTIVSIILIDIVCKHFIVISREKKQTGWLPYPELADDTVMGISSMMKMIIVLLPLIMVMLIIMITRRRRARNRMCVMVMMARLRMS